MAFNHFTEPKWQDLWLALGANPPQGSFQRLSGQYSELHRHYHDASHIERCLVVFEDIRGEAISPALIELSLWMHDAIYDTRRQDNEHRSALLASEFLSGAGLADLRERITDLIMATSHKPDPLIGDTALLVGIDLSILGACREEYESYSASVRQEYSWVSDDAFRSGRLKLLQSFFSRSRIYDHPACFERWECAARENISQEMTNLAN